MRILQRVQQLAGDVRGDAKSTLVVVDERQHRSELEQVDAVDPLHDQIAAIVLFAFIEHLDDVRVAEHGGELGLAAEHPPIALLTHIVIGQELDGDEFGALAPQRPASDPDLGHAATAEAPHQLVLTDHGTRLGMLNHCLFTHDPHNLTEAVQYFNRPGTFDDAPSSHDIGIFGSRLMSRSCNRSMRSIYATESHNIRDSMALLGTALRIVDA